MGPSLFEARLAGDRKGPGGCGCRHAVEMRADGFGPAPTAPDEQVGRERRATQEQGRLERDMRKLRRAKQVLEECGSDSHPENVRIRAKQAQLRALVRENGDLVKRERHRDRVYSKARVAERQAAMRRYVREANARSATGEAVLTRRYDREWVGGEKRAKLLSATIDEKTPCLRRMRDNAIVATRFEPFDASAIGSGWQFDWKSQSRLSGKVLMLKSEDSHDVQGLLAMTDAPEDYAVVVDLVESASRNRPKVGRAYNGVGAHLFAEAVKESYERGYNGFVYFDAKTGLIGHYERALGAARIPGTNRMFIDEKGAAVLYERYYGNER